MASCRERYNSCRKKFDHGSSVAEVCVVELVGLIVPVEDIDDAEDESWSSYSLSSVSGDSGGSAVSFVFAKVRARSLIVLRTEGGLVLFRVRKVFRW